MTESGFEEMKKMSHKCHTISAIFHKASCEPSSSRSCSADLSARNKKKEEQKRKEKGKEGN